ncbi:hypothetical protein RFI_07868 [Reticulomyxa filosa]|uniref:RGS domain-containing protein n=1 Tax=Reticulomyxa filosa TaxID=46433 RepID=X6NSI1_RETFI|nr:hypothetical protein RFI_07868 [Reticulomyxa filosa]|eukprot:ETO29255.1 hypothetical protein RFI_07868 [Reticulomyxa filosa]
MVNMFIWVVPLTIALTTLPAEARYERQLSMIVFISGLHGVNALIMLRPKDLYLPLRDSLKCKWKRNSGSSRRCKCKFKWDCFRIRRRYQLEYEIFQNHPSLDARTVANMSSSQLKEKNGTKLAIEVSHQVSLEDILSEKNGFELFASHLVKELSLENILFLVEYMQLKYFITVHQLHKQFKDIGYEVPIFPSLIQKSLHPRLLQTNLNAHTARLICLDMFHYLHSHYIMPGSVALLNISFEATANISHQMLLLKQDTTIHTLQPLIAAFDAAARDIVRLLRGDSFYRFQISPECLHYCEELA